MYKVLVDGTLLCDSRIEELALINPVVKLEENKAGSFSFVIPPAHPSYDAIQRRKSVVQVYRDEILLFSGICTKETKDFYKQKSIECEGELTYLNDSIQRPERYEGKTVRGLLEAYIANHNAQVDDYKQFSVGMVTVEDNNDYISCFTNMETTMKSIKEDLVDDLGGYIRVRYMDGVKHIDYLAESMNTNSQIIKIGKNLMDFTTNMDATDISTAIIPQGVKLAETTVEGLETRLTIEAVNGGLDYVHSAEAVESYGWIYKTVTWDNVTTPEALKSKAEKYLSDIQFENMVIQAKAVDLHLTNKDIEQFKISDLIRVVSAPHGLDRYFRLTKMTINLNNPEKDTVTLGKDERVPLSTKTNQANDAIKKAMESITPPSTLLQQAIDNATELIKGATNGYVTTVMDDNGNPKELLIMDTNSTATATKVWRWNINGLGYSNTGYNGEYALAMTMDGHFVADAITVDGLEVGKNVTMGKDASISWEQVTDAGTEVTQITKDTVTSAFIKALNLVVGNEIQMGENATISWDKVSSKPSDLAYTEDIPTADYITQITKDTITAAYINALKVVAGSVAAENITGTTISGKTISGGTVSGASIKGSIFTVDAGAEGTNYIQVIAGSDGKRYSVYVAPDRVLVGNEAMNSAIQILGNVLEGGGYTNPSTSRTFYIDSTKGNASFGGTLYTASGTVSKSDRDSKNSIEVLDVDSVADFIYSLVPSKFKFNDGTSNRFHHGLIAQEVKESMGDEDWGLYVDENAEEPGNKGLRYEELVSDLIATVQSQNERIKELEKAVMLYG